MFRNLAFSHQLTAAGRQRGFAMASAIFLLVILAALGGYMLTLSATQHTTASLDIQGARGYQAARAGIEWGAYQALKSSSCAASTVLPALASDLAGFAVTVQCTPYPASGTYSEGANTVRTYELVSTAAFGVVGDVNRIERQIRTTISICTDPTGQPC